jgi:DNA-directed RNA polymerase specialized sigma24 family protein
VTKATKCRPADFDAKVLAYIPMMRKFAAKLVPEEAREELVQDALLYTFEKWENFRGDWNAPKSGFVEWLRFQMRGVASNNKRIYRKDERLVSGDADRGEFGDTSVFSAIAVAPQQEQITDAKKIVGSLRHSRGGRILLRRAMGDKLREIAVKQKVSHEYIRVLEHQARAKLVKRTRYAVAA